MGHLLLLLIHRWQVVMRKISVVIPFYQRDAGVLGRTLRSVDRQAVPDGWSLEAIIVDDGSPVPAQQELMSSGVGKPELFRIIQQENAGVGAARNRGLDAAVQGSELIAFLDSDDIWPKDHIARAIEAIESGYDFYFTDNHRDGLHESQVRLCGGTTELIVASPKENDIVSLPVDQMVGLCLTEFPCQASTVVFRTNRAPDLRFSTKLKSSGEDVLYFSELISRCRSICFDDGSEIECGDGVNIYFGHLDWNSPRFLGIEVDKILTYRILDRVDFLSENNKLMNRRKLMASASELGLQFPRSVFFRPQITLYQFSRLVRHDAGAALMVLRAAPSAVIDWVVGKLNGGKGRVL